MSQKELHSRLKSVHIPVNHHICIGKFQQVLGSVKTLVVVLLDNILYIIIQKLHDGLTWWWWRFLASQPARPRSSERESNIKRMWKTVHYCMYLHRVYAESPLVSPVHLATLKKPFQSCIWLAVSDTSMVYLFISCITLEVAMLILSIPLKGK